MKRFITISSIFFLVLLLSGLDGNAQEKTVKLNFQGFHPETHWSTALEKDWAKEIEKGTDGTVVITRYSGGLLTPPAQTVDSTLRGIVDIGETVLAYTPGRFPFMEISDVPLGYKTAYAGGKLLNELYKKYKPKEFDDLKVLYLHSNTVYRIHAKKPIHKLEDLKGLKIRTSGGTVQIVKLLGATPVAMTTMESYDALSRGVVDANWMSDEGLRGFRLADVTKYSIWCPTTSNITVFIVAMNKAKWNSLSPKQQKVVEEATARLTEKHLREWDAQEVQIVEWAKKEKGVQFISLPEAEQKRWGDRVKPMAGEYIQKMKKIGMPGEEIVKFASDFLKANQ